MEFLSCLFMGLIWSMEIEMEANSKILSLQESL